VISGPIAKVMRTLATVVRVIATMKAVNMMAQHIPEIQITLGECSSLRHRPGPRIKVRATVSARALKALRQKVTSKLGAESRCRVTTPAMLQSRAAKIIRDTARKCDIVFQRKEAQSAQPKPFSGFRQVSLPNPFYINYHLVEALMPMCQGKEVLFPLSPNSSGGYHPFLLKDFFCTRAIEFNVSKNGFKIYFVTFMQDLFQFISLESSGLSGKELIALSGIILAGSIIRGYAGFGFSAIVVAGASFFFTDA
jgi:hypothetical protein